MLEFTGLTTPDYYRGLYRGIEMVDDEIPHEDENNDSKPPRMGERWSDEERRDLIRMALNGHSWAEIAELLGRSKTAVMYEFARLVEEGGWIEVEPPTITTKTDNEKHLKKPKKPNTNPIMNPGSRRDLVKYNVMKDSDGKLWYSFYIKE